MITANQTVAARERFDRRLVARNTAAAAAIAIPLVLIIRATAVSLTTTHNFSPLQPASEISLTVLGFLAAAATALLLNRLVATPISTFRRIVPFALGLSLIPDLALWASGGQARAATVLPLMLMHACVATAAYIALSRSGERTVSTASGSTALAASSSKLAPRRD